MALTQIEHKSFEPRKRTVIDEWLDNIEHTQDFFESKDNWTMGMIAMIKDATIILEPGLLRIVDIEALKKQEVIEIQGITKSGLFVDPKLWSNKEYPDSKYFNAGIMVHIFSSPQLKSLPVKDRVIKKDGYDLILDHLVRSSKCMEQSHYGKLVIIMYLDKQLTDIFEYSL